MSEAKGRKIRFVYGIVLSVLTVVIGALFIMQVLRIYYSGPDKPYSYELVSKRLGEILVPVCIWLVAVVGGAVVWSVFPAEEKLTAAVDDKATLEKLKKRLPDCGEEYAVERNALREKARNRKFARCLCAGLCVLSAIVCAIYLFDFSNFPVEDNGSKVTEEVVKMVGAVLPWIVACFIFCIAATVYEGKTIKAETAIVKTLIAENAKKGVIVKPTKEQKQEKVGFFQSKKFLLGVRIALLCCGVAFIIVGIFNGGMKDVFAKAIKICTECIGLG